MNVRAAMSRQHPSALALAFIAGAGWLLWAYTTMQASTTGKPSPADLHIFWLAGRTYLHGHNPYPAASAVGHEPRLFVYPAAMAALFALMAWMPFTAATALWVIAGTAAILAALWILNVRDLRCYAFALLSFPVASSITIGTLNAFLLLAVACLWRWRNSWWRASIAAAFLLVSKLFLWPLLVWLIATRRYRAALGALVSGAAVTLIAWAPIGFGSLRSYPTLLRQLSLFEGPSSYQPIWLLPGSAETRLVVLELLSVVGAGVILLLGRTASERASFSASLGIALALTPILWAHYLILLLPALAPVFSVGWIALLAFWPFHMRYLSAPFVGPNHWRAPLFAVVAVAAVWLSHRVRRGGDAESSGEQRVRSTAELAS